MTNVLHVSFDYQDCNSTTALVTPHYDLYDYKRTIIFIANITHIYKGTACESSVSCMVTGLATTNQSTHFLIKPKIGSIAEKLFEIKDLTNIYKSTPNSHLQNRIEYFNSAVATFVCKENSSFTKFDVISLDSYRTSIAACLIKEYNNCRTNRKKGHIPYIVSTLQLNSSTNLIAVQQAHELYANLDLSEDFVTNFINHRNHINYQSCNLTILSLLYSDSINILMPRTSKKTIYGIDSGLEKLLVSLNDQGRIQYTEYEATTNNFVQKFESISYRFIENTLLTAEKIHTRISKALPIIHQYSINKNTLNNTTNPIEILHIAPEYGAATLGGLGSVTTQMVDAQNKFIYKHKKVFVSAIITPYYSKMYNMYDDVILVTECEHLFDNKKVRSSIYLAKQDGNKHYMIAPQNIYKHLFDIESVHEIYNDTVTSSFIDRIKYFNSAAAAFIAKYSPANSSMPPKIIISHDWQAALVLKLLKDVYVNTNTKSIFIVHVSNIDCGIYASNLLQGIGIKFAPGSHMLKAIGITDSHKIVAVSPSFLKECLTSNSEIVEIETLRKLFVTATNQDKKSSGILNGFNFNKFSPLDTLIDRDTNIAVSKYKIKLQLLNMLSKNSSAWTFDPNLPVIFYVGRFSPEKGVDTFQQVIYAIKKRAIFFALGRGLTESVYKLIEQHSEITNNIFISYIEEDQVKYGAMMRACADFSYVPSDREACGLVPMEGFANGALCITSGVGGLRDSVTQINYDSYDAITGNGFIFSHKPNGRYNPALLDTIDTAITLWSRLSFSQRNQIHRRLMQEAKSFDWLATDGALSKYLKVCNDMLEEPVTQSNQTRMRLNV